MLTLCRVIIFIDGVCNFPRACARKQKRVNKDSCETNKYATQTLNLLREVYGVDAILRARMSEWQNKFFGRKRGHRRWRTTWPSGYDENLWKCENGEESCENRSLFQQQNDRVVEHGNRNGAKNVNVKFEHETCMETIIMIEWPSKIGKTSC
jgi:hypothetical protein